MKFLLTLTLLSSFLLAATLKDTYETTFITGCAKDAGKKVSVQRTLEICLCTWQGIDHKYTTDQLEFIDEQATAASKELTNFYKFVDTQTKTCINLHK